MLQQFCSNPLGFKQTSSCCLNLVSSRSPPSFSSMTGSGSESVFAQAAVANVFKDSQGQEITEEKATKIVNDTLSHQLKFFLAKAKVSLSAQLKLVDFGITDTNELSLIQDDKAEVRKTLKDEIKIEGTMDIGRLVGVWKTCNDFTEKESETVASSHAQGIFHTISKAEHTQLKMAYETFVGEKMVKEETPSKAMLSSMLDDMQGGTQTPPRLMRSLTWTSPKSSKSRRLQTFKGSYE